MSYDRNASVPVAGSRWVWEIDSPGARELIEVVEVKWNGEEWWVAAKNLLRDPIALHLARQATDSRDGVFLNDLDRFWEAVTPVGGPKKANGRSTKHRVQDGVESVFAATQHTEGESE